MDNKKERSKVSEKTKRTIGQRINAALAIKPTRQKELAEKLNITANTVSFWCSGKRTPNSEQLIQIAKILGVSTDFLLGLSDAPTSDKDLQFICDYTGLNLEAVCKQKHFSERYTLRNKLLLEMIKLLKVAIHNYQDYADNLLYVVTTAPVDGKLWFYGAYDDYNKALKASLESGGIIIEND